jgi:hypothetical protein
MYTPLQMAQAAAFSPPAPTSRSGPKAYSGGIGVAKPPNFGGSKGAIESKSSNPKTNVCLVSPEGERDFAVLLALV